jgi:membrane fusion protein (multidrug efflux system)
MKWTRYLKLSWVMGLLVITASLIGANHVLHAPARGPDGRGEQPPAKSDRSAARGNTVISTGVVVPENGMVPLVPNVKGEVIEVMVKNDQIVKKDDVLLKMDATVAVNLFKKAEVGVKEAERQLEQAKSGMTIYQTTHQLRRDGQLLVIEGLRSKLAGQNEKVAKLENLVKQKLSAQAEIELPAAKGEAKSIEFNIKAEQKKLDAIDAEKPGNLVAGAENALEAAKLERDLALYRVDACVLKAPADGVIMEAYSSVGTKFGEQLVKPAFLFYSGKLIVKAEIYQESAHRVAVGQTAEITDHSNNGQKWTGKVISVGRGFLPRREATAITDFIPQNQEMVLECRIALDPDQKTPFVNQKVRVRLAGN